MGTVDLNAMRAARRQAEAETTPPTVTVGDQEFMLPPTMPAAFLTGLGRMQDGDLGGINEALEGLFSDQLGEFLAVRIDGAPLDTQDLTDLLSGVAEQYGESLGNAQASSRSSPNGGKRRKRTSKTSTELTSVTSGEDA